ncbi:BN860_00694g1_1 [Zygosaccharomyces bailii CLIB 213]|uniref:BN860_00694g1_1 n=1 Tax=Zygosaccharomyces bailii (strain CLIB 213 / ATCC 58445 / CBS 680 / BCRC 21525 / NBRC 1098 / NCYC 1416 / NRRL Y-2227) TaxID=1333698 RepID=A0A8J2WVU3_ZYGB2|nr:BN860_00694g1_1 [Zygosaccharomyces bailii CLIB 213]
MLVPPANFGIAEEGIYRCSKVETLNLSFIETLNLRTVIFIGGQEPSKFFKESFNEQSIEWFLIGMSDFSSAGKPVISSNKSPSLESRKDNLTRSRSYSKASSIETTRSDETYHLTDGDDLMLIKESCIKKAFQLLLNKEKHNILLVDRTSIIVGVLRKIQKWNISSIINEYRLFSGKNRSYFAETFLEILQVIIEQEKDDNITAEEMHELNMGASSSRYTINPRRRLSHAIVVDEGDLQKPVEVPRRLLAIVDEAQKRSQRSTQENAPEMARAQSNLGIFGNRYRLAFNKRERGAYKYYNNFGQEGVDDTFTLQIPQDQLLPEWLKFQRDLWERENYPEEHNFYKEHIFV